RRCNAQKFRFTVRAIAFLRSRHENEIASRSLYRGRLLNPSSPRVLVRRAGCAEGRKDWHLRIASCRTGVWPLHATHRNDLQAYCRCEKGKGRRRRNDLQQVEKTNRAG